MHIDIRVAGEPPWDMAEREQLIRAKAAELVTAGATTVREESYGEHLGHVVMLDPEGNEFDAATMESQRPAALHLVSRACPS